MANPLCFIPHHRIFPSPGKLRALKLTKTYWILLSYSNQLLFVTPNSEKLSILWDDVTKQVEIKNKGKLTL
jgi:hypothetical protein